MAAAVAVMVALQLAILGQLWDLRGRVADQGARIAGLERRVVQRVASDGRPSL